MTIKHATKKMQVVLSSSFQGSWLNPLGTALVTLTLSKKTQVSKTSSKYQLTLKVLISWLGSIKPTIKGLISNTLAISLNLTQLKCDYS